MTITITSRGDGETKLKKRKGESRGRDFRREAESVEHKSCVAALFPCAVNREDGCSLGGIALFRSFR